MFAPTWVNHNMHLKCEIQVEHDIGTDTVEEVIASAIFLLCKNTIG